MALHHSIHGDVLRKVRDDGGSHTYEVRTNFCHCLVETDRDEHGEFFVDLASNWSHTEEEADDAREAARQALASYIRTWPSLMYGVAKKS
jgi:hypothetical protein